ncbi:MAG: helicase, partial [Muribaculaceae bacterium]|nr:helicase [Muribaculaceae bacterium]
MISPIQALQEQRRLLQIEYDEEKRTFSELTARIGFTRLAESGNAWLGIEISRVFYNSLNQRVLELTRPESESDDSDHNFEYGRPVAFFILQELEACKPAFPFTGTVSYVDGDRMVVAIPESADVGRLSSAAVSGVMLSFDETSYRTMFEALDRT